MTAGILEHANFSVSDPQRTADMLCAIFDWRIRWSGASIHGGHTIHVGEDDSYLAIYAQAEMRKAAWNLNSTPRKCLGYKNPIEACAANLGVALET